MTQFFAYVETAIVIKEGLPAPDIADEVDGEPIRKVGITEASVASDRMALKVYCATKELTKENLGVEFFATGYEQVAAWMCDSLRLRAAGTLASGENAGKFEAQKADGTIVYNDNPEA